MGALAAVSALVIGVLALSLHHSGNQSVGGQSRTVDRSVAMHVGPTLRDLLANFAVLRQPATAADRAMVARFTVSTNHRTQVPEYVRSAGTVNGDHVYFVVYPIFQHGSTGPVVAHQMTVMIGDGGYSYTPGGAYMIFPALANGSGGRQSWISVVPDDVKAVRWRLGCGHHYLGACQHLPERTVEMTPHDNLAVFQLPYGSVRSGAHLVYPTKVTWYLKDGSRTVFTSRNRNSAVPFPGAPPWNRAKKPRTLALPSPSAGGS